MSVVHVSPFRCRIWNLHDRIDDYVDEKSCRDEIQSFGKSGQLMPVLGRPVTDDPDFDIEIVCGARRLFVARHLNLPLAVELRPMSDREAVIAMDIENRQRQSVSPYERGLSYTRWIRGRLFGSQEELAKTIGISPSQVSRLMKMAKLPSAIINAFGNPTERRGWRRWCRRRECT